jgi:hypothetical protein
MTTDFNWIYESPDGGATVYRRRAGEPINTRELASVSPEHLEEKRFHERWHKFRDMLELAKTNPSLEKMLQQAEMYYELSK